MSRTAGAALPPAIQRLLEGGDPRRALGLAGVLATGPRQVRLAPWRPVVEALRGRGQTDVWYL
jgi:hypothetical protein